MYLGLLCQWQIPNSWHLLQNILQLSPVHKKWLDLLNLGALSVGVTNCQCSSEEVNIKQKPSTCSEENQKASTCSQERRFINLSLSIHWVCICSAGQNQSEGLHTCLYPSARSAYVQPAKINQLERISYTPMSFSPLYIKSIKQVN